MHTRLSLALAPLCCLVCLIVCLFICLCVCLERQNAGAGDVHVGHVRHQGRCAPLCAKPRFSLGRCAPLCASHTPPKLNLVFVRWHTQTLQLLYYSLLLPPKLNLVFDKHRAKKQLYY